MTKPGSAQPAVESESAPVHAPVVDQYEQPYSAPLQDAGTSQVVDVDSEFINPPGDSDHDSLYSSSYNSETTSLTPSVFDYTYENGRRYASDRYRKAAYFLPNDDSEQDRLDLYHHMFLLVGGGRLYTAPLEKPQKVLDVGTGTGIWAIDFAYDNPQAKVIGVDISPIQPTMVPPNCVFEVDDIEEVWSWPKNHFDYIHMRSMSGSIQHWETLLKQSFDHLQPGGILEFQDYGCEGFFANGKEITGADTPMAKYCDLVVEAAEKFGRPLPVSRKMQEMMEKAGFVDVHSKTGLWPLGDWPKDKHLKQFGRWGRQGTLETLEPFALQLLQRAHGMSVKEIKDLCENVRKDLSKASENRYFFNAWFVWGRKPEKSD